MRFSQVSCVLCCALVACGLTILAGNVVAADGGPGYVKITCPAGQIVEGTTIQFEAAVYAKYRNGYKVKSVTLYRQTGNGVGSGYQDVSGKCGLTYNAATGTGSATVDKAANYQLSVEFEAINNAPTESSMSATLDFTVIKDKETKKN